MKESNQDAQAPARKTYEVVVNGQRVVCRQPKRVEWRRYLDVVSGDKGKAVSAGVTLFSQCLVEPKMADLDPLFDDEPQLEIAFVAQFLELITEGFEAQGKAL